MSIENNVASESMVVLPVKKSKGRSGPTFRIDPEKSVINEVREAMRAFPDDVGAAAKSISMGNDPFRFIRRLILLNERSVLPQEDRELIKRCFEILEHQRQLVSIKAIGEDVIRRNWIPRKERPYVISSRRKRFDQTIVAISEGCESTLEMELPTDIEKDDVTRAIDSLSRSVELISRLIQKLVGGRDADG